MFDSNQPPKGDDDTLIAEPTALQRFLAGRRLAAEVSMPVLLASLIGILTISLVSFWYDVSNVMAAAVFLLTTAMMVILLVPKKD